ncbi:MAG: hypothetical protein ABSA64_04410 [Sedimentisphaerales bacterium]|jgi:uncharacterized protein YpmS
MKKDSEKMKKPKVKAYFWIAIPLVLVLLTFVLVTHRPKNYTPLRIADQNQISTYLSHYLMPAIYNNSQLDAPFEVVITEEGLNDIIARWRQPVKFNNITFTDPQAILTQKQIILMATARTRYANPVLTIKITPAIDYFGQLNIHVDSVSLGAAGVTTVAKSMGNEAFADWLSFTGTEPNDIAAQVCRSLLNDEPFEPVFKVGDKSLRICKIKLEKKKITALLLPLSDAPRPLSKTKTY